MTAVTAFALAIGIVLAVEFIVILIGWALVFDWNDPPAAIVRSGLYTCAIGLLCAALADTGALG